jgi:HEAT repeat protein
LRGAEALAALRKAVRTASTTSAVEVAEALVGSTADGADEILGDLASSEDDLRRCAALEAIRARGRPSSIKAIEPLLKHTNPGVRAAALGAFGACGGIKALDRVAQGLLDPDVEVRNSALQCVDSYGLHARSAVSTVFQRLGDPDRAAILKALKDPSLDAHVAVGKESRARRQAILQMLRREDAGGIEAARRAVADGGGPFYQLAMAVYGRDAETAAALVRALKEDPGAAKTLREFLASDSDYVGLEVALTTLLEGNAAVRREVPFNEFVERVKSPLPSVRLLATYFPPGDAARVVPLLASLLHDPYAEVRRTAASAIGFIAPSRTPMDLVASLEDQDPGVRKEAVRALIKCEPTLLTPGLDRYLADVAIQDQVIEACARYDLSVPAEALCASFFVDAGLGAWLAIADRSGSTAPPLVRYAAEWTPIRPLGLKARARLGDAGALTDLRRLLDTGPIRDAWIAAESLLDLRDETSYSKILDLLRACDAPSGERTRVIFSLNGMPSEDAGKRLRTRIDSRGFNGNCRDALDMTAKVLGSSLRVHASCESSLMEMKWDAIDKQHLLVDFASALPFALVLGEEVVALSHSDAIDHWRRWLEDRKK